MNIEEMLNRQKELLDAAEKESRDFTEDEQAEFDRLTRSIRTEKEKKADVPEQSAAAPEVPAEPPAEDEAVRRSLEAADEEMKRMRSIVQLCEEAGISSVGFLTRGASINEVRRSIMEHLQEAAPPVPFVNDLSIGESEGDRLRRSLTDAILVRGDVLDLGDADPGAAQFVQRSTRDMLCEAFSHEGMTKAEAYAMTTDDILERLTNQVVHRAFFQPTALFPAIMDDAMEKAITAGYEHAPLGYEKITTKVSVKDFKEHRHNYVFGGGHLFERVPEGGEMKQDTVELELLPTIRTYKWGKQWSLTYETIINDDIGLAAKMPMIFAQLYRETINHNVFSVLMENPTIYDGQPLFTGKAGGHANLMANGTTVTGDALNGMLEALRNQKDQFGKLIVQRAGKLLVPDGMQTELVTLFQSPTIHTEANTQAKNPWYNFGVEVITDGTINAMSGGSGNQMPWFLFAQGPSPIVLAYLNGKEGLQRRAMEVPGQLGIIYDIWGEHGVNITDYRQIVRNNGVTVAAKEKVAD